VGEVTGCKAGSLGLDATEKPGGCAEDDEGEDTEREGDEGEHDEDVVAGEGGVDP